MNPIVLRGIRESLRPKHLIAAGLFSLIVCSTAYLTSYLDGAKGKYAFDSQTQEWSRGEDLPINGARNAFTFVVILQGFYLMFLGTGRVASITAEERESGLLDYQRMTPMNPFSKIVGYIFGLPAREYYMFLFTIPFLIHSVIVGKIPWINVFHLYAVFFCSVILYHLTAHAVGLIVPKPRAASWVSRIVVLGLYVALPGLGQAGVSFLSFLTILPTYFGKILPVLHPVDKDIKIGQYEQLAIDFWQDVPFFDFTISPTTFTFLMQGLLILTLFVTAYRKWRNQALPAFSKSSGLLLFIVLQFLLLGSLWTFFAKGEASGLIGNAISSDGNTPLSQKIVFFILVESIFVGLSILALLGLTNICCPNRHLFLKGIQRVRKFSLRRTPLLADECSGLWFVGLLSGITIAVFTSLTSLALGSKNWEISSSFSSLIIIPSVGIFVTAIYLQAARETWFNLGFWGFVGLLWITPLLVCLVLAVGWQEEYLSIIYKLMSINPLGLITIQMYIEFSDLVQVPVERRGNLAEARWFGLILTSLLAVIIQARLLANRKQISSNQTKSS